MSKGFIILTLGANAEQQDAIGTALRSHGWWHRLPQAWLIVDNTGTETVNTVYEKVHAVCPSLTFYVFMMTPGPAHQQWTGYAPPEWHEWIQKNWTA